MMTTLCFVREHRREGYQVMGYFRKCRKGETAEAERLAALRQTGRFHLYDYTNDEADDIDARIAEAKKRREKTGTGVFSFYNAEINAILLVKSVEIYNQLLENLEAEKVEERLKGYGVFIDTTFRQDKNLMKTLTELMNVPDFANFIEQFARKGQIIGEKRCVKDGPYAQGCESVAGMMRTLSLRFMAINGFKNNMATLADTGYQEGYDYVIYNITMYPNHLRGQIKGITDPEKHKLLSYASALIHELFIHVEFGVMDFDENGLIDSPHHDKVPNYLAESHHKEHYLVKHGKGPDLWKQKARSTLKSFAKRLGIELTDAQLDAYLAFGGGD